MTRQLTEKQQKLLNVLFDEAGGNVTIAKACRICRYI